MLHMIIFAITNGIMKVFAILMDPSLKPLLLWKIKYDDDGDHDDDNDGDDDDDDDDYGDHDGDDDDDGDGDGDGDDDWSIGTVSWG